MNTDKALLNGMDGFLKEHRDEIIDSLIRLVRIPSTKSAAEKDAPYGLMCKRALVVATKLFEEHGYKPEILGGGRYAVTEIGSGEKSIGIFAHCDVVPAGDGWEFCHPFLPVLKDGMLIGRGVDDNKSGVVMSLFIPLMLEKLGIKLKNKLVCVIGSDEESGMDDIAHFVKECRMPDFSIVPDSAFPANYGEKGICRFNFKSTNAFTDILSFEGGKAFNIVLDKLNAEFKYSEPLLQELDEIAEKNTAFKVSHGRKSENGIDCNNEGDRSSESDIIKVTVTGVAKHAATPWGGINAAHIFASEVSSCKSLAQGDRELLRAISEMTEDFSGKALGIAHSDKDFGELTCVNGICGTVDGAPLISFDIRYGTSLAPEELEEKLYSFAKRSGFSVENLNNRKGFMHDRENKLAHAIEEVYCELSGDEKQSLFLSRGGTYSRMLRNSYSTGTEAYYIKRPFSMPEGHGGVHQCDEALPIDSYLEAIKVNAAMIIECDRLL